MTSQVDFNDTILALHKSYMKAIPKPLVHIMVILGNVSNRGVSLRKIVTANVDHWIQLTTFLRRAICTLWSVSCYMKFSLNLI